jgi:hypothetical protein
LAGPANAVLLNVAIQTKAKASFETFDNNSTSVLP